MMILCGEKHFFLIVMLHLHRLNCTCNHQINYRENNQLIYDMKPTKPTRIMRRYQWHYWELYRWMGFPIVSISHLASFFFVRFIHSRGEFRQILSCMSLICWINQISLFLWANLPPRILEEVACICFIFSSILQQLLELVCHWSD